MLVQEKFYTTWELANYVNDNNIGRKDIQSILQVDKELFVLLYWKD